MLLVLYRGIHSTAGLFESRPVVVKGTSYRGQREKTPGGILKRNVLVCILGDSRFY